MRILEKNNNDGSVNSIGKGSSLQGSINSRGDIRIDGSLKGSLIAQGRFVLGLGGVVEGEVECGSAIISGELKANIKSKELLILKETAKLYGDIETEKLSIEAGAMFSGKCVMGASSKPTAIVGKKEILKKNQVPTKEKEIPGSEKKINNDKKF